MQPPPGIRECHTPENLKRSEDSFFQDAAALPIGSIGTRGHLPGLKAFFDFKKRPSSDTKKDIWLWHLLGSLMCRVIESGSRSAAISHTIILFQQLINFICAQ